METALKYRGVIKNTEQLYKTRVFQVSASRTPDYRNFRIVNSFYDLAGPPTKTFSIICYHNNLQDEHAPNVRGFFREKSTRCYEQSDEL